MIEIRRVGDGKTRKEFLTLPFEIYKKYPNWVPPLDHEMKSILKGKGSQLLANGPHDFFIAQKGGKTVGRICVGIEEILNERKKVKHAYFTLFESENDPDVAGALLGTAADWARKHGMNYLKGPVSPTNGDDYRGILTDNFEDRPMVFMPYNPPYYVQFLEKFDTYLEYLAFSYDVNDSISEREILGSKKTMERFGFTVEEADFSKMDDLARDIQKVTEESMPDWEEDLVPPTLKEVKSAIKTMKIVADKSLVIVARNAGKPIGYFVALPDFNEIIKSIKGRLLPFGWLKFITDRKKIDGVRASILFVIPEYRKMGVPAAMFARAFGNIQKGNYNRIEGSSISSMNKTMIANAKRIGGKHCKTYKIFGTGLIERSLNMEEIYGTAAKKFVTKEEIPEIPVGVR